MTQMDFGKATSYEQAPGYFVQQERLPATWDKTCWKHPALDTAKPPSNSPASCVSLLAACLPALHLVFGWASLNSSEPFFSQGNHRFLTRPKRRNTWPRTFAFETGTLNLWKPWLGRGSKYFFVQTLKLGEIMMQFDVHDFLVFGYPIGKSTSQREFFQDFFGKLRMFRPGGGRWIPFLRLVCHSSNHCQKFWCEWRYDKIRCSFGSSKYSCLCRGMWSLACDGWPPKILWLTWRNFPLYMWGFPRSFEKIWLHAGSIIVFQHLSVSLFFLTIGSVLTQRLRICLWL